MKQWKKDTLKRNLNNSNHRLIEIINKLKPIVKHDIVSDLETILDQYEDYYFKIDAYLKGD